MHGEHHRPTVNAAFTRGIFSRRDRQSGNDAPLRLRHSCCSPLGFHRLAAARPSLPAAVGSGQYRPLARLVPDAHAEGTIDIERANCASAAHCRLLADVSHLRTSRLRTFPSLRRRARSAALQLSRMRLHSVVTLCVWRSQIGICRILLRPAEPTPSPQSGSKVCTNATTSAHKRPTNAGESSLPPVPHQRPQSLSQFLTAAIRK